MSALAPLLTPPRRSLNGSLIVNPWDKFAVADAIHEALTMDPETRKGNFNKLSRYVNKHTASWWGMSCVVESGSSGKAWSDSVTFVLTRISSACPQLRLGVSRAQQLRKRIADSSPRSLNRIEIGKVGTSQP